VRKQGRAVPMREAQTMTEQAPYRPDDAKARTQQIAPEGAAQLQGYADAAVGRICGDVRDPLGRPVAGAQVVLRETGTTARADAQGHFCLDAPAGAKTLAVMAVGYRQAELAVRLGADEQYASVQLAPVSPTGQLGQLKGFAAAPPNPNAPSEGLNFRGGQSGSEELRIVSETLSPAARSAMDRARRLSAISLRKRNAANAEAAAAEWERAANLLPEGAVVRDARFEAARERYTAWQRGHSPSAADFAVTAIRRFLEIEPAGPRYALVEVWLANLGH